MYLRTANLHHVRIVSPNMLDTPDSFTTDSSRVMHCDCNCVAVLATRMIRYPVTHHNRTELRRLTANARGFIPAGCRPWRKMRTTTWWQRPSGTSSTTHKRDEKVWPSGGAALGKCLCCAYFGSCVCLPPPPPHTHTHTVTHTRTDARNHTRTAMRSFSASWRSHSFAHALTPAHKHKTHTQKSHHHVMSRRSSAC
jgi:hypothetical protein